MGDRDPWAAPMTTCLGSPASARLVWACVLLLPGLYGCGDAPVGPEDGDVVAGIDLDVLFAPPDGGERAAVEADWAGRTPRAEGVTVEAEAELSLSGETMLGQVVSHVVDGHRHYGLILTPLPSPPDPLPVLVYAHGGDDGTSMAEVLLVAGALGLGSEDYVLVAPAYRSESVRLGDRRWISEGPASPWDGDVDDALSLVEVALATAPMADASRIGVLGLSRGGTVGLLMAIRDPRIRAVVSFFAPTDFFGPFVRDLVRSVLLGTENRALSGLEPLAEGVIRPLQQGRLGMGEARQELLRRSPAWFASRLPAVQIHHGTADEVVPEEEAERLRDALEALGRGPPDVEAHLYPGAGHNPFGMPESLPRTRSFLATQLSHPPSVAPVAGTLPGPAGSASMQPHRPTRIRIESGPGAGSLHRTR